MQFWIKAFRTYFPKELPRPLGRWKIDYCNTKTNTKIDLSNEDHCGPCGQYTKTIVNREKIKNVRQP